MPKQPAFRGLRDAMTKKQTRRELFLTEMDAVVASAGADRAALSKGWGEGWASADAPGDMSRARNRSGGSISRRLAADLFPAELVCAERPHGRIDAL